MQELCPVEKNQQETEERAENVACDVFLFLLLPVFICSHLFSPLALTSLHTPRCNLAARFLLFIIQITLYRSISPYLSPSPSSRSSQTAASSARDANALTEISDPQQVVCLFFRQRDCSRMLTLGSSA